MATCELNQIFLGEIVSVQDYGAFVKIPGCPQQGLVHRTQVSSVHVDNVNDVLQKREQVWCKVISIDDQGKVGLSMKYVNQGNGEDLDPNGVSLQRDQQKKKSVVPYNKKVIKFEAVLNTTCKKCGTHGHLSNDCFMTPDGKKYELIPEIEETKKEEPKEESKEEKQEKSKVKKSKKEKSSKRKRDDTDNNSDDNERKKKKKKKHSKSKKKKRKD